jgi:hypothetical protein
MKGASRRAQPLPANAAHRPVAAMFHARRLLPGRFLLRAGAPALYGNRRTPPARSSHQPNALRPLTVAPGANRATLTPDQADTTNALRPRMLPAPT